MDVKMPQVDGVTAAERIGEDNLAPVVMLTAFSQAELVERARDAGAMAYVVKPFTPADLLPAIEIAISRFQQITQLESEIADLGERFETRKRVDRAKGLLQTNMGLSEPEAFRWIQKTSMDRRLTMREVADAVVVQLGGAKDATGTGRARGGRAERGTARRWRSHDAPWCAAWGPGSSVRGRSAGAGGGVRGPRSPRPPPSSSRSPTPRW